MLRPDTVAGRPPDPAAAEAGDAAAAIAALDQHRLLCAHREGPFGVRHWNRQVEWWLGEELGQEIWSEWYVGRPLLVTANDYALGIYNGETGAAVLQPDGRLRAVISGSSGLLDFAPGRLEAVATLHAMTIHKSQGSQAERVTVLLPDEGSRLLTRELFYTAVTRAQSHVRVIGTEAAVRAAVATRAQRATGLRQRLSAAPEATPRTPKQPGNRGRARVETYERVECRMPFLLRVELSDVPGSLGRLASAIGEAGGDIEAIEIVEKRHDGPGRRRRRAARDAPGTMPDSIVSACNALEGVRVVWISRYAAGGNLFLDLEAVEEMTANPAGAIDRLVDLLPITFRADWAARVHAEGGTLHATEAAPSELAFSSIGRAARLETDDDNVHCGARLDDDEIVVIGRRGGPDFLDSELARLGHIVALARSIAREG